MNKNILGDAIEEMNKLQSNSVDLILTDLPYGTTRNKWDIVIPFDDLWSCFKRILKPSGKIVLTAAEPFSSVLITSNLDWFKYDLIWEKTVSSGQLNVKHMPLRNHEQILVFYNKSGTYNEQREIGEPYSINRKPVQQSNYNTQTESSKVNDGFRHAKSVIKISNPRVKGGHPTQKPLELFERLIKTYSNENDLVLDCCAGSFVTAKACKNLNRHSICIEKNEEYYKKYSKEQ